MDTNAPFFRSEAPLPDDRDECIRMMSDLTFDIDSITAQIKLATLAHESGERRINFDWLSRAQRSISYKRRDLRRLQAHSARLKEIEKAKLETILLDVLRSRFDETEWKVILSEAYEARDRHLAGLDVEKVS